MANGDVPRRIFGGGTDQLETPEQVLIENMNFEDFLKFLADCRV